MKTVYALDRSSVKIYGNHSSMPVIATAEVVAELGGEENTFHAIKKMEKYLPGPMLEAHPLGMLELGYARENQTRGQKYWQWRRMEGQKIREAIGYDYVNGYGHPVAGGFAFVNTDSGATVYVIPE